MIKKFKAFTTWLIKFFWLFLKKNFDKLIYLIYFLIGIFYRLYTLVPSPIKVLIVKLYKLLKYVVPIIVIKIYDRLPTIYQQDLKDIYDVVISQSITIPQKAFALLPRTYQKLFRQIHQDLTKLSKIGLQNKEKYINDLKKLYQEMNKTGTSKRNILYNSLQYTGMLLIGIGFNWLCIRITNPLSNLLHPILVNKFYYGVLFFGLSILWTLCTITPQCELDAIKSQPLSEQKYFEFKIKLRRLLRNFSIFWIGNSFGFFAYEYFFGLYFAEYYTLLEQLYKISLTVVFVGGFGFLLGIFRDKSFWYVVVIEAIVIVLLFYLW